MNFLKNRFPWLNFYRKSIQNPRIRPLAIFLTLLYFLSPIDIIPDFLLPFGWIDDGILASVFVMELFSLLKNSNKDSKQNPKIIDVETKKV
jgi:uncharacterized membrane protein YkvA (DUF1232 family)